MRHISLLLAAAILASAPASAATLLEQTGLINGGAVTSTDDTPSFDDFSLSDAATINSVSWWTQLNGPTTANFTIRFTTTAGFYPDLGNVLYSQTVSATSHTVGVSTEKFDVDLPVAAFLPGQTNLFISITSDLVFYGWWGLAGDPPSPGVYGDSKTMVTYRDDNPILVAANVAWALNGSFGVAGPQGDVPEPASWALMLGGFGMVGGALRSRRKVAVRFA
jgi:hypothetical protein